MSTPRQIIAALGRGGSAEAIVKHLAEQGPSTTVDVGAAVTLTSAGARAQLIAMQAGGLVDVEADCMRAIRGIYCHRYFLDPGALRYAARWLDALADRAERANRAANYVPLPNGRTR